MCRRAFPHADLGHETSTTGECFRCHALVWPCVVRGHRCRFGAFPARGRKFACRQNVPISGCRAVKPEIKGESRGEFRAIQALLVKRSSNKRLK